jgi:Rod binding domain-containing protein
MTAAITLPVPGLQALDLVNAAAPAKLPMATDKTRLRAAAQDFEAVFINSMLSQMYTGIDGEGPFGGSGAVGVWRSFLSEEYAKSFAKAGGIGIADHVYRSLLAQQEVAN